MWAVLCNGRIESAGEHPVNADSLLRYEELNLEYSVIELPERTMEDILQHVIRPKQLQDEIHAARDENGTVGINANELGVLNFMLANIAIIQYMYDMEWEQSEREIPPVLKTNLENWLKVKLSLLAIATGEELLAMGNELHKESFQWQNHIIQAITEYDTAAQQNIPEATEETPEVEESVAETLDNIETTLDYLDKPFGINIASDVHEIVADAIDYDHDVLLQKHNK